VSADFQQENMIATLTALFGALGLVLAAVGLYGVLAYMVERRTGEIGMRMALGADRGNVVAMVFRDAFLKVGVGLAVGLPAAIGAGKLMSVSYSACSRGIRLCSRWLRCAAWPGRPGGLCDSRMARCKY
jgi:ABC-type antimicrobial peptide transport system permease subunit